MRVSVDDMHRNRNRKTDRFGSSSNQPQSFGDFGHGYYSRPENQVNLLALLLTLPQEQGDCLASTTGDEEPMYIQDEFASSDRNSPNQLEKAHLVPFHLPHLPRRNRKERHAYSLLQTTMEPLPHGL